MPIENTTIKDHKQAEADAKTADAVKAEAVKTRSVNTAKSNSRSKVTGTKAKPATTAKSQVTGKSLAADKAAGQAAAAKAAKADAAAQVSPKAAAEAATAAQNIKAGTVAGVGADEKIQKSMAVEAKALDKLEVDQLKSKEVSDQIVSQLLIEIRSTMPRAMGELNDKQFEKVLREEVAKTMKPRLEDRSTVPVMIARVKTDVKARIEEAAKQASAGRPGGKELSDARIDQVASRNSPVMMPVESLVTVAEAEPNFDTPAHKKAVEAEQKRLSNLSAGIVEDHKEMSLESAYHFQRKMSEKQLRDNPLAQRENVIGRLVEIKGGKAEIAVINNGTESGRTSNIDLSDYDIRRVSRSEANDLSHI